jgi:hypothetical protein
VQDAVPAEHFQAADDALLAAFRLGGMSVGQLHAERRFLRILHALHDAVLTLAGTSVTMVSAKTEGQPAAATQVAGKSL